MPRIGEQGDVLRALGQFFDEQRGTHIMIEVRDPYLTVAYAVANEQSGQRYYQDQDLGVLRAKAQLMRSGQAGVSTGGTLAESFRTLGQELDEAEVEMRSVAQDDEGLRVSGMSEGRYHTHHAFWYELEEASARHRAQRGCGGGRSPLELDPFLGVTAGMRIFTRDGERVGRVGQVCKRSLKVETPLFRRSYWLPAACVESARPGQPVRLAILKQEIKAHMLQGPAAEALIFPAAPREDAWY